MPQCDDCGCWYDGSLSRCKFCGYDPEQGAKDRDEAVDRAIAEEEGKPKPTPAPAAPAKPIPEAPKHVDPPVRQLKDPHLYQHTIECPDCGRVYASDRCPERCSLCSTTLPEPRLLNAVAGPARAPAPAATERESGAGEFVYPETVSCPDCGRVYRAQGAPAVCSLCSMALPYVGPPDTPPIAPAPVRTDPAEQARAAEARATVAAVVARIEAAKAEAARPKGKKPSLIAFIVLLIIAIAVLVVCTVFAGPFGIFVAFVYLFVCIRWYVRRLRASR